MSAKFHFSFLVIKKYKNQQIIFIETVSFVLDLASIYLLKVNNRNTRTRCEICSKLTIKTPERHWRRSGVFIVNFEHISHLVLMFLLLTLNMQLPTGEIISFSVLFFAQTFVYSKMPGKLKATLLMSVM